MEDDDEFGDLYTDILRPFAASFQSQQPPTAAENVGGGGGGGAAEAEGSKATETLLSQSTQIDPKADEEDGGIIIGAQKSNYDPNLSSGSSVNVQEKTLAPPAEDKLPRKKSSDFNLNLNQDIIKSGVSIGVGIDANERDSGASVFEKSDVKWRDLTFRDSNFTDEANIDVVVEERDDKDDELVQKDEHVDNLMGKSGSFAVETGGSELMIPGVSIPGVSGAAETFGEGALEAEWDSDSDDDDDLRIVLNDHNHGPMGMDRMGGMGGDDDDDDDGEPLVIVTDNDDPSHQPTVEEQEWGDEQGTSADGERKDDTSKVVVGTGFAPKVGYSNHVYHHPYHSQFKVSHDVDTWDLCLLILFDQTMRCKLSYNCCVIISDINWSELLNALVKKYLYLF